MMFCVAKVNENGRVRRCLRQFMDGSERRKPPGGLDYRARALDGGTAFCHAVFGLPENYQSMAWPVFRRFSTARRALLLLHTPTAKVLRRFSQYLQFPAVTKPSPLFTAPVWQIRTNFLISDMTRGDNQRQPDAPAEIILLGDKNRSFSSIPLG